MKIPSQANPRLRPLPTTTSQLIPELSPRSARLRANEIRELRTRILRRYPSKTRDPTLHERGYFPEILAA